jgi:thymidine kinase
MCKLVFYYSSMNSGKSLAVLTKNYMLKEKGFKTVLMKPSVDTRTAATVATRLGLEESCAVLSETDLPSHTILKSAHDKPDFIIVDEAQFLTKEQVWDLAGLVDNWGINVYCYGLRLNWQGEFFTGSEELMKIADVLEPIENFCQINKGALAFFHIKKAGSDKPVEVGMEDMYDTASRKIWKQWFDTKKPL